MFDLFWLTDAQMTRLEPYLPKPYGKPRVDDRRILSDRCPEVFLSVIDLAALAIYWQCVMSLKLPFVPSSESVILGSSGAFAALCLNGCTQKVAIDGAGEWPSIQGLLGEWRSGAGIYATVTYT
jgi:hypothetical protein